MPPSTTRVNEGKSRNRRLPLCKGVAYWGATGVLATRCCTAISCSTTATRYG